MNLTSASEDIGKLTTNLFNWYIKNQRVLPWREQRDPYKIWVSEIMLQQTTITAVIPYFEKFIAEFPDLKSLAQSNIQKVLQLWSGLGYYSRVRNLHKAAQEFLDNGGIPTSYKELIHYPGLGPYTSRAISSIAFEEKTGVLDGNVIRILTRLFNLQIEWWTSKNRSFLQNISDKINQFDYPSSTINQALMELGAIVCTPLSPDCDSCPWTSDCLARIKQTIPLTPIKKPRKKTVLLLWKPVIRLENKEILMQKNTSLPFLRNQWLFPGILNVIKEKPDSYHFKHHITHYGIYVQISEDDKSILDTDKNYRWFGLNEIKTINPSSLIDKCLKFFNPNKSSYHDQKK